MGIVSQRKRQQRLRRTRRRLMIAAGVLCLAALAMAPEMRQMVEGLTAAAGSFSQSAQAELTLPEYDVYALQLGVFDNGERAAEEAKRLQAQGIHCIIWQRERMRIISSAAYEKEKLDMRSADGREAYVICETLPQVGLRISADASEMEDVKHLLELPDSVLRQLLLSDIDTENILTDTRRTAEKAQRAHPENELYTQLALSLINWCQLLEQTLESDEQTLRTYAAVTMCTLCRELRFTLRG